MRRIRPFVVLTLLVAVAAFLLPPAVVCAAISDASQPSACPMAAMQAAAVESASCHGTSMTAETDCCCAVRERAPLPLPATPDVAMAGAWVLEAPAQIAVLAPLAPQQFQQKAATALPPHPKIDLFIQHSAYLI